MWLYFEKSLRGKALRATAVNRTGARLMGISTVGAGRLSFTMAAFIGALSGLLAFYLCEYLNMAPVLTAAVVGVAGHMGTRGINWIEDTLKRRVDSTAGQDRT